MSLVSSANGQHPVVTDVSERPLVAEVALRRLQHRAAQLLTSSERRRLRAIIAAFRHHRQVATFTDALLTLLDTPAKRHLLVDLRSFVPTAQRHEYGRLLQQLKQGVDLPDGAGCQTVVTLMKDEEEPLGFSIRGGSEHGLGIFVSELEESSAAALAGLRLGDNITEVNSVRFDKIASCSAVKVLVGSNRLRMIVRHTGLIPGFRAAREKTAWYDVVHQRVVRHLDRAVSSPEMNRHINLTSHRHSPYRGFNIRGGREYGLGIYVSSVDAGGAAEQKGLKCGDEILDVNGVSLDQMTHAEVVSLMKQDRQLILTVNDVGRYPVFKEVYAEYKWMDAITGMEMKTRTSGEITSVPVLAEPNPQVHPSLSFGSPCWPSDESNADDATEDRLFSSSDSLTLFSQRVLRPGGTPVILEDSESENGSAMSFSEDGSETKLSDVDASPVDHQGDWTMLGARAMELETRRENPELWKEFQENGGSNGKSSSSAVKKVKSRTFRELIFGTKSRETGKKMNATEGARSAKPWRRKPLSNVQFAKPQQTANTATGIEETTFSHGMGSQLMLQDTMVGNETQQLSAIDKMATMLLNSDEVLAVHRHIRGYKETGNISALISPLVAILDSPQKWALFSEIRTMVAPKHIRRFDSIVAAQNHDVITDAGANTVIAKATIETEPSMVTADESGVDTCPLTTRRRLSSQHFGSLEYWDEVASATVVHSAPPDARHDLEIHRFRSNSKVYRAEAEGEMNVEEGDVSSLAWIIAELGAEMEGKGRGEVGDLETDVTQKSSSDDGNDCEEEEEFESPCKKPESGVELTLAGLRNQYSNAHEMPSADVTLQRLTQPHVMNRYYDDDDDDEGEVINEHFNATYSDDETSTADGSATCGEISEATASLDFLDNLDGADDGDNDEDDDDAMHAPCDNDDTRWLPEGATISLSPSTVTEHIRDDDRTDSGEFHQFSPVRGGKKFKFPSPIRHQALTNSGASLEKSPDINGSALKYPNSPSPSRKLSYPVTNADDLDIDKRMQPIRVVLDKRCRSLGMSISGGRDSPNQPEVKVQQVLPGGAVHEEGTIQCGMRLLSIDGDSLRSVTHAEAVEIIRHTFMDKTTRYMSISLIEDGNH